MSITVGGGGWLWWCEVVRCTKNNCLLVALVMVFKQFPCPFLLKLMLF